VSEAYSDEELLAGYQAGQSGCFDELVRRYAPELYRFLVRFTGDAAAGEDLLQETFLQLCQSAGQFDPSRRLRPWLFTIAANKARDWLRVHRRRTEVSLDAEIDPQMGEPLRFAEIFGGTEPVAAERVMQAEQRELVRQVIDQMPDSLREVLLLGYFHQLPYKEIAEILGVPVGTVKSRLHTAVKRFGMLWWQKYGENVERDG